MTDENLPIDENKIIAERRAKLAELREQGQAFPNDFRRESYAGDLHEEFDGKDKASFDELDREVSVAGRIVLRRIMGKASFITLQDMTGRIQCYLRKNELAEGVYNQFKRWDLGDLVGAKGKLFKTNTGELSVHLTELKLLTKSLRPLPDKHKGLADMETRYRQRYVDLIVNDESRNTFIVRSRDRKSVV